MNKFTRKLMEFMYGRYGTDELYYGLFALWAVVTLVNFFVKSKIIYAAASLIIIFMLYRTLSKKIEARRRENAVFLKIWKPVKNCFLFWRDRIRGIKTFRYRKCPKCGAILKLPNKKGKHTTTCPRCHNRFDVRIL